jgi:hypothetical protein
MRIWIYSRSSFCNYIAGGTELVEYNLAKHITKRTKTHNTRPDAQTENPTPPSAHTTRTPAAHTKDTTTTPNTSPKVNMQTDPISPISTKNIIKAYNLRRRESHNTNHLPHTQERRKQKKIINKTDKPQNNHTHP